MEKKKEDNLKIGKSCLDDKLKKINEGLRKESENLKKVCEDLTIKSKEQTPPKQFEPPPNISPARFILDAVSCLSANSQQTEMDFVKR